MFVALLSSGEYIQLEEGESDVSIWQVPDDFAFDQGGEVERIARDGQDVFSSLACWERPGIKRYPAASNCPVCSGEEE